MKNVDSKNMSYLYQYQNYVYIYWKNILEDTLKIFQYIYFIFKNLICYDLCHFFTNDIPFYIEIFNFF
jgi:hypothetical protein